MCFLRIGVMTLVGEGLTNSTFAVEWNVKPNYWPLTSVYCTVVVLDDSLLASVCCSVILDSCHAKLSPVIDEQCRIEETQFHTKLIKMAGVRASQIGLEQDYVCDLSTSVS